MPAIPKVDDQFWFDESRNALAQAAARQNEASAKVATALVWLWGVYTAAITVGTTLPAKTLELPLAVMIMLVVPIPLLLGGYVCATWAQVPPLVEFDPRSPTEIQQGFSLSMVVRRRRLAAALTMTALSALMVSLAISVASCSRPKAGPSLRAVHSTKADGAIAVAVTGVFVPSTAVHIRIVPITPSGDWDTKRIKTETVLSSPAGGIQIVVPMEAGASRYEVVADWTQNTTERGITTLTTVAK